MQQGSQRIVLTFTTAWAVVSVVAGTALWWVGEHPQRLAVEPTPLRQYVFMIAVVSAVPFCIGAAFKGIQRRRRDRAS